MNSEYLMYASLGLNVVILGLVVWNITRLNKLDQVRKQFFSSGLKKDLEQVLVDQNRSITSINNDLLEIHDHIANLATLNKNNFQKIGFLRFNPFGDAGGNISFVLALLNAHNDGVVISGLHGREGNRTYAKAVKDGKSESKLTEEEEQAIADAK